MGYRIYWLLTLLTVVVVTLVAALAAALAAVLQPQAYDRVHVVSHFPLSF